MVVIVGAVFEEDGVFYNEILNNETQNLKHYSDILYEHME